MITANYPRFSFILPTVGRRTLHRAIMSAIKQMSTHDEILLITDATRRDLKAYMADRRIKLIHCTQSDDWGNPERRLAIPMASGTHICILDDDDQYLPGALQAMRNTCIAHPERPIMFRMVDPGGLLLWVNEEIACGNHGGPQFVAPNIPDRLGTWGKGRREADFEFCCSTLERYPDGEHALVWDQTVTYGCRGWIMYPHKQESE